MGQITIYLDDETERRVRSAARSAGVPVSRWVAKAVTERSAECWPVSVENLVGCWDDVERPTQTGMDVKRERL